jgi:hypothetical protein
MIDSNPIGAAMPGRLVQEMLEQIVYGDSRQLEPNAKPQTAAAD